MTDNNALALEALKRALKHLDQHELYSARVILCQTIAALESAAPAAGEVVAIDALRELRDAYRAGAEDASEWHRLIAAEEAADWILAAIQPAPSATSADPTVMEEKGEREAFEAWCPSRTLSTTRRGPGTSEAGHYFYLSTADAWAAWQARASVSPRPDDDALWDQTLKERDDYHEWADQLAARISTITGVDIGEHSSSNRPWRNAADAADEFTLPAVQPEAETSVEKAVAATPAKGWRLNVELPDKLHVIAPHGAGHITYYAKGACNEELLASLSKDLAAQADAPVAEPVALTDASAAALCDIHFARGAQAGFQCGIDGDEAGFAALIESRSGAVSALKVDRRPPAPEEGEDAARLDWFELHHSRVQFTQGLLNGPSSWSFFDAAGTCHTGLATARSAIDAAMAQGER